MPVEHNHLAKNGKPGKVTVRGEEKETSANLGYLTGIIDLGTVQRKKYQSEEMEGVRMTKLEFTFPNIDRTDKDGNPYKHIKAITTKISKYKADSAEMSNAKMVDIMIALGAKTLPLENADCLSFMKETLLNKPLLIHAASRVGNDGNTYDEIVKYEKLDDKVIDGLDEYITELGNPYFDFENYSKEDFDSIAPFHKKEVEKAPEFLDIVSQDNGLLDDDDFDDLPFS